MATGLINGNRQHGVIYVYFKLNTGVELYSACSWYACLFT